MPVASCRSHRRTTLSIRAAVAPAIQPLAEATRLEIDAGPQTGDFAMHTMQSRRDFSPRCQRLAEQASSACGDPFPTRAPPETTTIRLARDPNICLAPLEHRRGAAAGRRVHQYPLHFGPTLSTQSHVASLISTFTPAPMVVSEPRCPRADHGVGGVHSGCYELFAHAPIQTISDLKGKRIGLRRLATAGPSAALGHGGARRARSSEDIKWITSPTLIRWNYLPREVDAFIGFPPEPQELRAARSAG